MFSLWSLPFPFWWRSYMNSIPGGTSPYRLEIAYFLVFTIAVSLFSRRYLASNNQNLATVFELVFLAGIFLAFIISFILFTFRGGPFIL